MGESTMSINYSTISRAAYSEQGETLENNLKNPTHFHIHAIYNEPP
jgi:hypothetical protein